MHANVIVNLTEADIPFVNARASSRLSDELRLHDHTHELLTWLTCICRRLALEYQSNIPGDLNIPVPTSTSFLMRDVYCLLLPVAIRVTAFAL